MFVCLFGVYRPTREFFTQMETSPLPVKCCKPWPTPGTQFATEQWVLPNVPHLLRHGPTVHNSPLRGSVTPTSVAERLAVELSLPFFYATASVLRIRFDIHMIYPCFYLLKGLNDFQCKNTYCCNFILHSHKHKQYMF